MSKLQLIIKKNLSSFSVLFLSPHPIIDPPQKYYDESYEDENEGFVEKFNGCKMTEEIKARWIKNRRGYRALVHLVDDQIGRRISTLKEENLLEDTILDAIGLDPKAALSMFWPAWNSVIPSRSLLPILMGKCDRVREYTFTENDGFEMIQTTCFKYVRRRSVTEEYAPPIEEFYDLINNPLELDNKITDKIYTENIEWCCARRDFVLNSTPTGQMRFVPLILNEK